MNWEKFNNRLRKDAEGQNNDVDIDSIWSAIEPQVDEINTEKKKKRRGLFFWWGAGILLLSVGLWFSGNQFFPKENMAQNTTNQTITTDNKNTTKEKRSDLIVPIKPTQEVSYGKNDLKNKSGSQKDNSFKSTPSKNKNQSTTNKSILKSPQSTEPNVVLIDKTSPADLPAIVVGVDLNEGVILRGSHSQKDQNRVREEIFNISSLLNLLDFSSEKISLSSVEKVWTPPSLKKNRFSIGIYGGVNYTHRTLAEKGEETSLLLRNRETYETPLETSQVGINFSYKILNEEKYNLEITTGLQLTSIAERYKIYKTTSDSTSSVFGVQYLSYGLGTEPIEIMGWVNRTKTIEYKKEIFNTYRMIDIPILIGYNRSLGKKWEVGIQGGIFANLSLQTEGIIPNSYLNDIDIASEEFNIFKSKVGLSYYLGLSVRRELTKRWELNISPSVRYFGNDFSNDNYGLSQKYMLFGGNVGVRYKF